MHWFYSQNIAEGTVIIEKEEALHAIKVLRLTANDEVIVIDGKGTKYHCRLTEVHKKEMHAEILKSFPEYKKRPYHIHLAIAPTKNISRFEWFLEKCTEIGIDEISPLLCQRSERKVIKEERLNKILLAASKQSQKALIPTLNSLQKFDEFIKKPIQGAKYIAHCDYTNNQDLLHLAKAEKNYTLLIGPEGDFSEEEVNRAKDRDFVAAGLGPERLRTETAGIVACQTFHFIQQKAKN